MYPPPKKSPYLYFNFQKSQPFSKIILNLADFILIFELSTEVFVWFHGTFEGLVCQFLLVCIISSLHDSCSEHTL